jgi:hypothetical protein
MACVGEQLDTIRTLPLTTIDAVAEHAATPSAAAAGYRLGSGVADEWQQQQLEPPTAAAEAGDIWRNAAAAAGSGAVAAGVVIDGPRRRSRDHDKVFGSSTRRQASHKLRAVQDR